jgi:hypothetical protein
MLLASSLFVLVRPGVSQRFSGRHSQGHSACSSASMIFRSPRKRNPGRMAIDSFIVLLPKEGRSETPHMFSLVYKTPLILSLIGMFGVSPFLSARDSSRVLQGRRIRIPPSTKLNHQRIQQWVTWIPYSALLTMRLTKCRTTIARASLHRTHELWPLPSCELISLLVGIV